MMPKMKPILFNTEMVSSILEDRKTVTRRISKIPDYFEVIGHDGCSLFLEHIRVPQCVKTINAKYKVGDILYVRETWNTYTKRIGKGEACRLRSFYGYKASPSCSEVYDSKWKPSIHMPKEASRLFLRVTGVRVERLQDITEEKSFERRHKGIYKGL